MGAIECETVDAAIFKAAIFNLERSDSRCPAGPEATSGGGVSGADRLNGSLLRPLAFSSLHLTRWSTPLRQVSRESCVDQVVDDAEIGKIQGQQRDLLHSCCRRDRQVELASTWFAATLRDSRREPPPSASDLDGDRERVECCFDDRQSVCPTSALVVVPGKQRPEMQLRY